MRLLIVDDGHYVVEYIKHLLDWSKFGVGQVETLTNSIEAKRRLDGDRVDILITDIRMPEVSGLDLLQHIQERKLGTKVVFLSGYSQFEYAQMAVRLGALDYLLKPVDKEDMEKAMSKVVRLVGEREPGVAASAERIGEEDRSRTAAAGDATGVGGIGAARVGETVGVAGAAGAVGTAGTTGVTGTSGAGGANSSIVETVQAYVADHLDGCLSLEDLGRIVHLHPVYLSKLYKQETGENLSNFIFSKRLEKAARLLKDSELHVVDISRMVGYKKTQYFIKVFKEQYGLTPYQYRRNQRGTSG